MPSQSQSELILSALTASRYGLLIEEGSSVNNNDIMRRLRFILEISDEQMLEVFAHCQAKVTLSEVQAWQKSEDHPDFVTCQDLTMAMFLNGLIIDMRGERDGPKVEPESSLTNNIILKKIKIAFDLKNEDIMEILARAKLPVTKYELTGFFRKPDHKNYRKCQDKVLRYFLTELQKMAAESPPKS